MKSLLLFISVATLAVATVLGGSFYHMAHMNQNFYAEVVVPDYATCEQYATSISSPFISYFFGPLGSAFVSSSGFVHMGGAIDPGAYTVALGAQGGYAGSAYAYISINW